MCEGNSLDIKKKKKEARTGCVRETPHIKKEASIGYVKKLPISRNVKRVIFEEMFQFRFSISDFYLCVLFVFVLLRRAFF